VRKWSGGKELKATEANANTNCGEILERLTQAQWPVTLPTGRDWANSSPQHALTCPDAVRAGQRALLRPAGQSV
jgi:hypothetical protein